MSETDHYSLQRDAKLDNLARFLCVLAPRPKKLGKTRQRFLIYAYVNVTLAITTKVAHINC